MGAADADDMPTIPPERVRTRAAKETKGHGRKLLVVDDNRMARTFLRTMLADLGWVVETATSCEEAVDTLLSFEPSVVVSDVRMPGVPGDEFCRMIKAKLDTRVVLYSALSPGELGPRAQAAGADGWASKEQGTSALLETIARLG